MKCGAAELWLELGKLVKIEKQEKDTGLVVRL